MGISYYNGSGYPDPTAHYAVRHLEKEEKMLHTTKYALMATPTLVLTPASWKMLSRTALESGTPPNCSRRWG